jgi:hypothetical protein
MNMQRCASLLILMVAPCSALTYPAGANPEQLKYNGAVLPTFEGVTAMTKGVEDPPKAIYEGCLNANPVVCPPGVDTDEITVLAAGVNQGLTIGWPTTGIVTSDGGEPVVPAKAEVKLCFSLEHIVDRPWRKFKNEVKDNKQCVPKEIDTLDWAVGTKAWTVKSSVPRCIAYITVFAQDKDNNYLAYGQTELFKITGWEGLDSSITIPAVILSVLSLVILVGYFVWLQFLKKDA